MKQREMTFERGKKQNAQVVKVNTSRPVVDIEKAEVDGDGKYLDDKKKLTTFSPSTMHQGSAKTSL